MAFGLGAENNSCNILDSHCKAQGRVEVDDLPPGDFRRQRFRMVMMLAIAAFSFAQEPRGSLHSNAVRQLVASHGRISNDAEEEK